MESYKEDEEKSKTRELPKSDSGKSIPEQIKEMIVKTCAISNENDDEDLISEHLDELSSYCEFHFDRHPFDFDYASNLEIIIKFIDNESAKVCCSALRVLRCFADFHPEESKPVLNNVLIYFPIKIFQTHPKIDLVFKKELIESLTQGLRIVDETRLEKTPFDLHWLPFNEEDAELEDTVIEDCLILSLQLIKELTKIQWPMENDFDDICGFIEKIFDFFYDDGLREGRGKEACDLIIQIIIDIINSSPEARAEPIKRMVHIIQDFFFFNDDSPGELNYTFISLLSLFSIIAKRFQKEEAREILSNIILSEIYDYVFDCTNPLLPRTVINFINGYLELLPDKCYAESKSEVERLARHYIYFLSDSPFYLKIRVVEFYFILFNNSELFAEICASLCDDDSFLSAIHSAVEAEDKKLSEIGGKVIALIAKLYPTTHEKLLDVFGDLIDDGNEYLEDLVELLKDVMIEDD
jgi:hypothetical protein